MGKEFIFENQVRDYFSRLLRPQQNLLTALFFTTGSPLSIFHLQTACQTLREQNLAMGLSSSTVQETMKAINFLTMHQKLNSILRRYFLVRLLTHFKKIEKSWNPLGAAIATSGMKITTWAINEMMSLNDPSVLHPPQQSQASPAYVAARKQLTNQIRWAQNYHTLVERFGLPILALILTDHDIAIGNCSSVPVHSILKCC